MTVSEGKELARWADSAMFESAPMQAEQKGDNIYPKVHLLWATPDPMGAVAAACRMYEGKPTYQLEDITDEERYHYWEQVKKTHLKAPLEFVKLHFFLEGVTRSFTHQMVRQRTAVYAQESLRFAVLTQLSDRVAYPPSLEGVEEDDLLKHEWDEAVATIDRVYNDLVNRGMPAEDARGLLPHNVTTRLHYCTDLRALLDHAGNRLCTQAQFEWRYAFAGIVEAIRTHQPQWPAPARTRWQFEHIADDNVFRPKCFQLGHCPFTAEFDRGCTIRDRVQAGQWSEIHDAEWLMDPTAARRRSDGE